MIRYKVVLAMRSNAFPHVDTLATYRVVARSTGEALRRALLDANREGMPTESVRRITVSTVHAVTP